MRDLYLAKMGITHWRLRDVCGGSSLVFLLFPEARMGLVAKIESEAEKELLDKIAAAISKAYVCVDGFDRDAVDYLFLLGDVENPGVNNIIEAASLKEMLLDVNLKKELWNKIKSNVLR